MELISTQLELEEHAKAINEVMNNVIILTQNQEKILRVLEKIVKLLEQ